MFKSIASKLYGSVVNWRNKGFDNEKKLIIKSGVPVISVGNLSVGGTGKTPFVQMLARGLRKMNRKPAIIGKGYKRQSKDELIISDGEDVYVDAKIGGDEMILLAESLRMPVIVHEQKSTAALSAVDKFNIDTIVVDDGFQHRKLFRDLDIVLLDKETIENPQLLPKGRLREPLNSLNRADIVCLTGQSELTDEIKNIIRNDAIVIRVIALRARPYNLITGRKVGRKDNHFMRKGIVAVSGIAKPYRFHDLLVGMKFPIMSTLDFPDHHNYTIDDMKKIKAKCDENKIRNIAITEKDAVKLREFKGFFEEHKLFVYIFPIRLKIVQGRDKFFKKLKSILNN